MSRPRLDTGNPKLVALLDALFVPYSYGAGAPSDGILNWPEGSRGIIGGVGRGATGWDCSGFAQAALVRLGLLAQNAPDRGAAALQQVARKVVEESAKLGDLAFYGPGKTEHVMLYVGGGIVLGASGGNSATNGNVPGACVMLRTLRYRADLLNLGRLA